VPSRETLCSFTTVATALRKRHKYCFCFVPKKVIVWCFQDVRPDTDEADGQDETLVPVDYQSAGMIVDDEIFDMLVAPLPKVRE
jgi:hypothetical protein